jgi:S-adenosylmethionine:tRNA ribosyltransferase-isomerase
MIYNLFPNPFPVRDIHLPDYTYDLPDDRIARFPLPQRDQSKLQVYRKGEITHSRFDGLPNFIPEGTLLVFNNTRVIPARIYFQKPASQGNAGAVIEIFLLEPEAPSRLLTETMQARGSCTWHCLIGNKKRWRQSDPLVNLLSINGAEVELRAELTDTEHNQIRLSWEHSDFTFADIIRHFGEMPLPPYLKRKAAKTDEEQYQTVYSEKEGAVAAPTAGLHFTPEVLQNLSTKGIITDFLTLHVGAGTFQPIKHENVWQHPMHAEQLIFTEANVRTLLRHLPQVFAVGTTSMRALESLYWYGVKLWVEKNGLNVPDLPFRGKVFRIEKLYPYQFEGHQIPTAREAVEAVLTEMQEQSRTEIAGETEILMAPGYTFRIVKGLVTNYHLPGTTLMLLVAAFIGEDWRRVYQEALDQDYRFLSYGDSSLLIP